MPTVNVFKENLERELGRAYTDEEFDELCFEFGIELDDVTNEAEMVAKERGEEAAKGLSKAVIYKIEVPANRYDLLCTEGICQALRIFKEIEKPPTYTLDPPTPSDELKMVVHPDTARIRPFVVCAILRGISLDQEAYESFIDLQDKLHLNICRKRTLVAIGTHDLDTLKGPFKYTALPPEQIKFVPLNQTETVDGHGLMKLYEQHQQLKTYLHIIRDSPVFPVIYDSAGVVLSMPPIINGDHSKISTKTKNVFIECTATDLTKAQIVLNTVVAMFSKHCAKAFTVEPVRVEYDAAHPMSKKMSASGGASIVYPEVKPREMEADVGYIRTLVGAPSLNAEKMASLLSRMGIGSRPASAEGKLACSIPITRSDVLHECDLAEDVAIAYGYNNIEAKIPPSLTFPAEQPINKLTDFVRQELAQAGFCECLTWGLGSFNENNAWMRRLPDEKKADSDAKAAQEAKGTAVGDDEAGRIAAWQYAPTAAPVRLSNPKTKEFEVVRTSLLPGLLKTYSANKSAALPIQLFEVSDVVVLDSGVETGARNVRRAAALYASLTDGFQVIHGLLDQVLGKLMISAEYAENPHKRASKKFRLEASEDPAFFPGRQASIVALPEKVAIGVIGIVHPKVILDGGFDITTPVSMFEFNLEPILEWTCRS
uniref:phenylalanine--tRNA ligase n=1 Tax=Chromera velia CCMP2878 TaxID=1169474 RepID=A0A0G4GKK2_9ALVE|eukprot:Cvel_22325.t1-p1 / transcript=Cvel_22325.t1 / gene=Cvel_22325 / organism=Chromera_velia_CCMP2878 / gene_product=Probable phenylalanine--tRNA ligase beta subunit, putative / transcript_product=Probable phenylalanine--tRNA ligase beta subunit, putative / location=Cvel_scaffold2183:19974-28182(-) / protein_length=654 / sequence_SO=supercontig / SO=protein_coding / is_pseudo=false